MHFRVIITKTITGCKNSAKEKEKLANMMAFGQDIDPQAERLKRMAEPVEYEEEPELDRFDECKIYTCTVM